MKTALRVAVAALWCLPAMGADPGAAGTNKTDAGSTSGGAGFTRWLQPTNDPELAKRVARGMGARDRRLAEPAMDFCFTYPAGESPAIFPEGWVFGARCVVRSSQGGELDLSQTIKWSGTGEFHPAVGARTRPSFREPGTHTISIEVDVGGRSHQKSIEVDVVNFFTPDGRFKYAAMHDIAQCEKCAHGCPRCPHFVTGHITEGSTNVLIYGYPAARKGDKGVQTGCCGPNTFEIAEGDPRVLIDGRPAARLGDMTRHCGGTGTIVHVRRNFIPPPRP